MSSTWAVRGTCLGGVDRAVVRRARETGDRVVVRRVRGVVDRVVVRRLREVVDFAAVPRLREVVDFAAERRVREVVAFAAARRVRAFVDEAARRVREVVDPEEALRVRADADREVEPARERAVRLRLEALVARFFVVRLVVVFDPARVVVFFLRVPARFFAAISWLLGRMGAHHGTDLSLSARSPGHFT